MIFGKNISLKCQKRGWSLTKLSKVSGVPVQTLHGWVTGKAVHKLDQAKAVAQAFEMPLHELLFGEPDPYQRVNDILLKELFSGDVRVTIHRIYNK